MGIIAMSDWQLNWSDCKMELKSLESVPDSPGVYLLWASGVPNSKKVFFVEQTESLYLRMRAHMQNLFIDPRIASRLRRFECYCRYAHVENKNARKQLVVELFHACNEPDCNSRSQIMAYSGTLFERTEVNVTIKE